MNNVAIFEGVGFKEAHIIVVSIEISLFVINGNIQNIAVRFSDNVSVLNDNAIAAVGAVIRRHADYAVCFGKNILRMIEVLFADNIVNQCASQLTCV